MSALGGKADMTISMSAFAVAIGGKADMPFCTAYVRLWPKADIHPALRSEDRIDHLSHGIARCRELIAVAVSQMMVIQLLATALWYRVGNRCRALRKNNCVAACRSQESDDAWKRGGFDGYVLVRRLHKSTIGCARYRSYARTATVDKIAQPMGNLAFCRAAHMSAFAVKADILAIIIEAVFTGNW